METMSKESISPKILEKEITFKEIAELEKPLKNIIEQTIETIERGEYGIIIGDDASGRIPTLVLGGFIKRVAELKKLREPEIIFIPGKLPDDDVLIKKLGVHLAKHGLKSGERVLIVTDVIVSGHSLTALSNLLEKMGFRNDIATIGLRKEILRKYEKSEAEINLINSNIISGGYIREGTYRFASSITPLVYNDPSISGVYKKPGDLKSRPRSIRDNFNTLFRSNQINKEEIQENINKYRLEVGILVDRLFDWYLSGDRKKEMN